ncbi:rhodopsin, GQ-coupled-like [Macrobrachium rosenbergii]|uniref:rhodopsin, GQ-coupled-like n=1 Tax=Macrobrachium rosenbergii TaxID=79674 RepID=UPI0034D61984
MIGYSGIQDLTMPGSALDANPKTPYGPLFDQALPMSQMGPAEPTYHPYPPLVASRMMAWLSTPTSVATTDPMVAPEVSTTITPKISLRSAIPMALTRPTPTAMACAAGSCPWFGVVSSNGRMNQTDSNFPQNDTPSTAMSMEYHTLDYVLTSVSPREHQNSTPSPGASSIPAPQPPVVSSLVAAYLIVVVIVSVAANTVVVVVRVCGRRRRVRSSHVCTLCLAVSDIAFSILVHTIMILAALGVDPMILFDTAGCNYYGFSAMFFGTFSMCIHASVSVIRYINICHPEKVEWLQLKYVYLLILGSFIYSTAWATGPLFHWGRYETFEFGCTLAFSDPTRSGRSFVTCAFIFVLLLPLGVVLTCYMLIVMQANKYQWEMNRISNKQPSNLRRKSDAGNATSNRNTQRSLRLHYKLVRMSLVVAIGYVLGWMPYAIVCMWATYGDYTQIPEGLRIGASLFCKSATAYNPFIYYFMSEGFRADLRWLAKRAGLSVGQPVSESTFHLSCRSSTRSSAKKSKDRTRENSLNIINMERKDSNSTCLTSGHMDTPSTPLSFLIPREVEDDLPFYSVSKKVSISSCSRRSSGCSHMSILNPRQKDTFKNDYSRRVSETPLSTSRLLSNDDLDLSYTPRRRLTNNGCDLGPLRYQCRRSVSFSISPTGTPEARPSPKFGNTTNYDLPMPHRSFSFYGFRDNKKFPSKRPK